MHHSALDFGRRFFEAYKPPVDILYPTVIDIGSADVNGSLRQVCPPFYHYIGVDTTEGPGVDVVAADPYALPIDRHTADLVVSTSCFEHCELFWLSFLEAVRICKPTGVIYLNVPSNGPVHRYPVDCWRFYPDAPSALVTWARRDGYSQLLLLESFTGALSEERLWKDSISVYSARPELYPGRITQTLPAIEVDDLFSAATTPPLPPPAFGL